MSQSIAVIGGGWAGLAAAVDLAPQHEVHVYESAKQWGGRARSTELGGMTLDNGQHLLLGAYREWLALLKRCGIDEDQIAHRQALQLIIHDRTPIHFKTSKQVPAPLHLLVALLSTRGLPWRDRWSSLLGMPFMMSDSVEQDISVDDWLRKHRQAESLCRALWRPLCLAALNTHSHQASAQVFARTLQSAFNRWGNDSDLLLPRVDLHQAFPGPATDYLARHAAQLHLQEKVTSIIPDDQGVSVVSSSNERHFDAAILATPAWVTKSLLAPINACAETAQHLGTLSHAPICTVYLQFPQDIRLPVAMMGNLQGHGEWWFDRRLTGQKGLISVVISGDGPHTAMGNPQLIEQVSSELHQAFPTWPGALDAWVIREKRATFDCRVGVNLQRPSHRSGHDRILLAGDYTATLLPATLEGAVLSGRRAAQAVLDRT